IQASAYGVPRESTPPTEAPPAAEPTPPGETPPPPPPARCQKGKVLRKVKVAVKVKPRHGSKAKAKVRTRTVLRCVKPGAKPKRERKPRHSHSAAKHGRG